MDRTFLRTSVSALPKPFWRWNFSVRRKAKPTGKPLHDVLALSWQRREGQARRCLGRPDGAPDAVSTLELSSAPQFQGCLPVVHIRYRNFAAVTARTDTPPVPHQNDISEQGGAELEPVETRNVAGRIAADKMKRGGHVSSLAAGDTRVQFNL